MLPSIPIPVDAVVARPNTDKIKAEDEKAEDKVEDKRKEAPKEPFDAHLNRVMPPGWAPLPEGMTTPMETEAYATAFAGAMVKPAWLMKALGDLPHTAMVEDGFSKPVVLHVLNPTSLYDAHQVLEAVKEGAPIHEAHFPSMFVAQFSQMQVKGEPVSRLSVQIAPEHLGKLQMTFTLQQQTVAVSVLAANQQAKEMLERQLNSIQSVLTQHNLKPAEIKVEVASQGAGTGQQQFSEGEEGGYSAPNRWMMRRAGDLDEGIDVTVG